MNTILIYGNNKISEFLHTAFGESGIASIDITQNISKLENLPEIDAILDVSNAESNLDESTELIHNTSEIKELLDLAYKVNSPYIFLYREKEETRPESTIITALDLIKAYGQKKNVKWATVQTEDIYGTEINTSRKLEEYVTNLTGGGNTLNVSEDENEHYLIHQKDFTSGLKAIIKALSLANSKSHYTLYPEDSITEIELAHFIKSLCDFEIEISYTHEDKPTSFVLPESEVVYPENWYPEVELETGIKDLFDYFGIPIKGEIDIEEDEEEYVDPLEEDDLSTAAIDDDDDYYPSYTNTNSGSTELPFDPYDQFDSENKNYQKEDKDEYAYNYAETKSFDKPTPIRAAQTLKPSTKKTKKGGRPKKAIAGLMALLFLALNLPTFSFAYNAGSGLFFLNKATDNINSKDLTSAYTNSNRAIEKLEKVEKIPFPVQFLASRSGIKEKDQYLFLETTKEISYAINYLSGTDLYATFRNLNTEELASNSNVLGASTVAEPEYIDKSLEKISKVENNFETLETRNKFVRNLITDNLNSLNKNKEKLTKIKNIEPALSTLLGYQEKQTYLLLVQNLNTARSSGGKVEVYGILEIENGKLNLTELTESKEAHSQIDLNGQIPAPQAIASLTDQENLYIEDVTWEPDFETSAEVAMNLFSYMENRDLDGVISIDTNLLTSLLSSIGEIHIQDQSINANNLEEKLLVDDSSSILKQVTQYIFDTFKGSPDTFKSLEPALYSGLNNKNLMIYHSDETTYTSLIKNQWAGILKEGNYDEFVYLADNNLTDIPSSLLEKQIIYQGTLPTDDQGYTREIEIVYKNTADSDYVGHLMALTPGDTLLNSATFTNKYGDKNITRSVQVSQYKNKALYETDLYIPTKQTVSLKIEFSSPQKVYEDNYIDIAMQKQPGSEDIPVSIKLLGDNTSTSTLNLDTDKNLKYPL